MVTYPFSKPDPVPDPGQLFPYWCFKEFTTVPRNQTWKMIVLENSYLRVKIFPQVGGKVWSIYDKTAGAELFYDNDVVKFREIAMRGPWTSGGIEFNYGIIGHAPTCSCPVDWKTQVNADGSVSCLISATELLSRSRWTIEINLPADAVWVRTSSVWHNSSSEYQPYYNWANSAVKTTEDMMLVYPANNAISHGGDVYKYPVDDNGNDFRFYKNQAYGADKSYHMVGSHKPFFGAYYPGENRGVVHYSLRDEKLGRKYFCWAQSDQGNIWVDLLTDSRPQYVEMQSGKLFNQNYSFCSENSPYRQVMFTPYGTDRWSDYWMPYAGIGACDDVNLFAITSVSEDGGNTQFRIYPLRKLSGELTAFDSEDKVITRKKVSITPARAFNVTVSGKPSKLKIGSSVIWRSEDGRIDRPQKRNADFDPSSPYSRLLMARDLIGMKSYRKAEAQTDTVLMAEPANIEALNFKAGLLFRRMEYQKAYEFSDKALAVDQYSPDAGYIGALAALALGKIQDAMDRLEVAAIAASALRTACYTELAKIHFLRGDVELSSDYAKKALRYNADNITAARILCLTGDIPCDRVSEIDPMDHFASAQKLLDGKITPAQFCSEFKEEMAWEACMDLALFYSGLGLKDEAAALLEAFEQKNVLTSLWTAYLRDDSKLIPKAEQCSLDFVFPFRRESAPVLRWALDNGGGWRSEYLLAMLYDNFGYEDKASALLKNEGTGFASYYAYRYKFTGNIDDLKKASNLQKGDWLYLWRLSKELLVKGEVQQAIGILEPFCKENPNVLQTSDALVDAYIASDRYADADKLMETLVYLPFEGQRASHDKYRNIKLELARVALDAGEFEKALEYVKAARLWPSRLGAGKPYDDLIDTSAEDKLEAQIKERYLNR